MNGTTIKTILNEPKSKNDIKYANESFRYESILDHNVSERVFKMLSEAENLIEDGYVPLYLLSDPEIYEAERIKIFATSWNFLAHESEIPYPGDYVVRYIEQTPLIVVRGEDNIIRVFLNVCPHKGREFVKAEIGNTSHIRCPYHGFVYNTRGKLVGCPVQKHAIGDIINYNDFNMYRINSEIYHGFTGLFSAITITVFGFGGFRQPIDYSEEVKNPGRSIPIAIVVALLGSGLIFTLEAFVFAGAINFSKFGIADGNWSALLNYSSPYATIAKIKFIFPMCFILNILPVSNITYQFPILKPFFTVTPLIYSCLTSNPWQLLSQKCRLSINWIHLFFCHENVILISIIMLVINYK